MIRTLLITVLAIAIPATHSAAQTITESINREVAKANAAQSRRTVRRENPYQTPGLVLVGLGGAVTLLGLLYPTGVDCTERGTGSNYSFNCGTTYSKARLIGGTSLAGIGGYLLLKGHQESSRAPQLVPTYRGLAVRQQIRW